MRCGTCAKTTQVVAPWARPNSGFSLLMEALRVTLCKAMAVFQVAQLLGVSDGRIWRTLDPVWIRSTSYQAVVCEHLPGVAITFDEFHVMQLVNKAVDGVRCQEVKRAPELQRTRYIQLKGKHAWSRRQKAQFAELKSRNLKTHRAFRIKETLREIFHNARSAAQAEPLLDRWYSWARRCRLEPIKAAAKTLKNHWLGLLNGGA